jgi:septin family protein
VCIQISNILFNVDNACLIGEHGLGKSTFINTLFMTELYADRPSSTRCKINKNNSR